MKDDRLEANLRPFTVAGRPILAHGKACADGLREDRRNGLIYPSYRDDDLGCVLSVEQASKAWGFCAYCGIPREQS